MLVWLSISMLLVIACIIFGVYSFIKSRSLQKSLSPELAYKNTSYNDNILSYPPENDIPGLKKQTFANLTMKLKSIEENSLLSAQCLYELKKRIETLESGDHANITNEEAKWIDPGEDWEKLYYETRREKQTLEEDLANLKVALRENLDKLQELEKQQAGWAVMKSNWESQLSEVGSLQKTIDELQRKLKGARDREKELVQGSSPDKSKHAGYDVMQKENNQLRSQVELLTSRLEQINRHNVAIEEKIKSLSELGSILEISEYEKSKINNSVKQLLEKI
jgi:DNA repair exonuclease SbcCD ATPase subunit